MANPKLTIEIVQKGADGVVKSLKEIEKQGNTTYTRVIKDGQLLSETTKTITGQHKLQYGAITAISTGYLAAAQAYGVVKGTLNELIDAGIEEQRSITRRDTALKNLGDTTGEYRKKLEAQAKEYLNSYGLADDYTRSIQAQLGVMGVSKENIEALTRASIGLAEKQGIDGVQAAKLLARFTEGLTGTVRGTDIAVKGHIGTQERVKIAVDKTAVGFEILGKRMSDDEGNIEKAKAKWQEVQETLGLKILPIVSNLAGKVGAVLDWYNGLDPGAQNIVLWGAAAAAGLKPLVDSLKAIVSAVEIIGGSAVGRAVLGIGASGAATAGALGLAGAVSVPYRLGDPEFIDPTYAKQMQRGSRQDAVNYLTKVHGREMPGYIGGSRSRAGGWGAFGRGTGTFGGLNIGAGGGMNWAKIFSNDVTGQLIGSAASGGGIGSLLSIAGGAAFGPLGGLAGGLLGRMFGGGHKKPRGETPGQPVYVQDVTLTEQLRLLNSTMLGLIKRGSGGIDNLTARLANQRAGVGATI